MRSVVDWSKDFRVKEGLGNGLVVQARTEDAKRRGAFVFAMENGTREELLQFVDG